MANNKLRLEEILKQLKEIPSSKIKSKSYISIPHIECLDNGSKYVKTDIVGAEDLLTNPRLDLSLHRITYWIKDSSSNGKANFSKHGDFYVLELAPFEGNYGDSGLYFYDPQNLISKEDIKLQTRHEFIEEPSELVRDIYNLVYNNGTLKQSNKTFEQIAINSIHNPPYTEE